MEPKYTFTINTDASRDPISGVSAWACWIKSSHYKITTSGAFAEPTPTSSVAEMLAIEQALLLLDNLIDSELFLRTRQNRFKVYINTDSKWCLRILTGDLQRGKHMEIGMRVKAMTHRYDIVPRHVKAHTKGKLARDYVNAWCDREAKAQLRAALQERQCQTTK